MGSLNLPASGLVYVDANSVIYTIETHPTYRGLVLPLWTAARSGQITIVSSELTLLETLVLPFLRSDVALQTQYEQIWEGAGRRLLPITREILRDAATALRHGCALFVSNDGGFRRVPNLSLALLDDVIAAP